MGKLIGNLLALAIVAVMIVGAGFLLMCGAWLFAHAPEIMAKGSAIKLTGDTLVTGGFVLALLWAIWDEGGEA